MNEGELRLAKEEFACGRFQVAAQISQDRLGRNPDDPGAVFLLGTSLARLGRPGDGLPFLAHAAQLEPRNLETLIEASICARLAGSASQAVDFGEAAVAVQPKNPKALCFLGLALAEALRFDEALDHLERAIKVAPNHPQVLHNYGLVLKACGRDREAVEQFRKVVSMAPQAIPSRLALAELLLKQGHLEPVLREAQSCLRQDGSNVQAALLAARACIALSMDEDADRFIDLALSIQPDNHAAILMKAFRIQAAGDFSHAKSLFQRSLEVRPIQGAAYWGLQQGDRAVNENGIDEILQVASQLSEGSLERAYAYFAVAKIFGDLKRYESAMVHYDLANRDAAIAQNAYGRYDPQALSSFIRSCEAIFTPEFSAKYSTLGDPSNRPIFIVGMMRSGTTLMEQILTSHPEVSAAGEQQFWTSRVPLLFQTGTTDLHLDRVSAFQKAYLETLGRYSPAGRVTDKMPQNARFIGLIKLLFPNAAIIHMNRDMVDVGLSIYTTPYEISPEFAHVQAHIADACQDHLKLMSMWRSSLPTGSFLDVGYSELIDDPERVIREVLDYCGLAWDDACLRHSDNERTVSTPSVWQVRQPIYSSSRGRWKNYAPYLGDLLRLASADAYFFHPTSEPSTSGRRFAYCRAACRTCTEDLSRRPHGSDDSGRGLLS